MHVTRRRFMLGTAGAFISAAQARAAWPVQAMLSPDKDGPGWAPNAALLRQLPRLLELASVPGLGLGVVEGPRVWTRGFGRAVEDPAQPASDDTVFEAASLGKPIFAYAVLRLVDAKVLDLDKALYHYLPIPEASSARMSRVTVRQVLSHMTGLPNWRQLAGPLEPAEEPGKKFSYSGEAYFYLQRVVEAVTGKPFSRVMQEQVFEPFEMKQSSYVWLPSQIIVNEGDEVTLEFVGINGSAHPTTIEAFGKTFTVTRGGAHRVTFVADKVGIFGITCGTHKPSMSGELIVMPRR